MSVKNGLKNWGIDYTTIGTIAGFFIPACMIASGLVWFGFGIDSLSYFQNILIGSLWIIGGAISAPLYGASVDGWGWN